jgi:hypothetical protein
VNGNTAQWDNNITIVQSPLIASIRPHSAALNSTVSVSVTGANLGGANFTFNNPLLAINSSNVSADGTSATLNVTAGAIGHYALAATNASGNSTFIISLSNSFCVSSGSDGIDLDGDGLSDAQEIAIGTDACTADTDGDGFTDGVEVATGSDPLDPNATPLNSRVPNEGYPAFVSVLNTSSAFTNTPNEVNGLLSVLNVIGPNGAPPYEADYQFLVTNTATSRTATLSRPATTQAQSENTGSEKARSESTGGALIASLTTETDSDGDGLSDAQEQKLGTDPSHQDTDGDGFPDGLEVLLASDPLDPHSTPDTRPPGIVSGVVLEIQNSTKTRQAGKQVQPAKGEKHVAQTSGPLRRSTVLDLWR